MLQKILANNVTVRKQAKALLLLNTLSCNDESHRFKGYEVLQTMLNNNVTVKKHHKAFFCLILYLLMINLTGSKNTKHSRKYSLIM